jgi:protocatechuate 3,4-dioxygenase beta subunit
VFDGLPPGRYRIDAQKATFASPLFTPDPSAFHTFQLAAGQTLDGVNIPLLKGAVITGQILDPSSGEPVVGTMVMAMRRPGVAGGGAGFVSSGTPRLVPAGQSVQTNDLGEFRIFGLPPGEYVVAASRPPNSGFAPTGGIAAVFSFYPGTPDATAAQSVTVAAGQVATGFVMRLVTPDTYQVSGTVVDQNGTPVVGAMVMLRNDPRTSGFMPMPVGNGRSDANGNFVISGIAPGSYQTMASVPTAVRSQNSAGGGIDEFASRRIFINGTRASDQIDVTVTNANVEGVQIVVQRSQ